MWHYIDNYLKKMIIKNNLNFYQLTKKILQIQIAYMMIVILEK